MSALPITFLNSSDEELEFHIAELGQMVERAMADGDRAAAVRWSNERTQAIKSRSAGYVKQLEQERGLA